MKGKPKTRPTTEERATITTLTAAGASISEIARTVGRSRHLVRDVQNEPKVRSAIVDEKQELADLYRGKARDCVVAIDADKIEKSSALQLATASGILLDKSQLLTGQPTGINVTALLDVVAAIRHRRDEDDERETNESRRLQGLPPLTSEQIFQEHLESLKLPRPLKLLEDAEE